jgi:hypothetical protein
MYFTVCEEPRSIMRVRVSEPGLDIQTVAASPSTKDASNDLPSEPGIAIILLLGGSNGSAGSVAVTGPNNIVEAQERSCCPVHSTPFIRDAPQ